MSALTLEQLVKEVKDIPALPDVIIKIIKLADDPNASAQQISKVITTDQSMTAHILKLANSAFYGVPRRISTVSDAVVLLGFKTIKSLAFAASTYEILGREVKGYSLNKGDLWRHSIGCAVCAQVLAKKIRYRLPEEAFVAGLIHDVGKIILNVYVEDQFAAILQMSSQRGVPFMVAEQVVLGYDHAEVGAKVAEKWNLPKDLIQCIRFHHTPGSTDPIQPLSAIVHVADIICMTMGIGVGGDGLLYPLEPAALQLLGLQQSQLEEIISSFIETISQARPAFDMERVL
ncbi:MAG: HDOD domain-containing protein [Armatimonadetes bacterium]|nr:HDOD domain-containing protein [Armatimonadota bacterium]